MKFSIFTLLFLCCVFLTSCFTTENIGSVNENTTSAKVKNAREIILGDKVFTAEDIESVGGTTSWVCMDWYTSSGNKVLLEIGYFTEIPSLGFILYDDTNKGDIVYHNREGLDHRWDWSAKKDGGFRYSFVIEPDGSGKYYNFPEGEHTAKPSSLYRTKKRE